MRSVECGLRRSDSCGIPLYALRNPHSTLRIRHLKAFDRSILQIYDAKKAVSSQHLAAITAIFIHKN
jgi:hypothetical protein